MERFVCLNNSYLDVNARFLAVYEFLDIFAFFCGNFFVGYLQETHQLCFNNRYEYISNSDFRKHQDSLTWFCEYLLLLDVSHLHHIFLLPSDVNHLCDVEHLDVVKYLGITGQVGVQEKTEKVEGRRTNLHG